MASWPSSRTSVDWGSKMIVFEEKVEFRVTWQVVRAFVESLKAVHYDPKEELSDRNLDLDSDEERAEFGWSFSRDLRGVFGSRSNHDVHELLEKAGVYRGLEDKMEADCEMACYYVYFCKRTHGFKFVKQLNEFIQGKADKLLDALGESGAK